MKYDCKICFKYYIDSNTILKTHENLRIQNIVFDNFCLDIFDIVESLNCRTL